MDLPELGSTFGSYEILGQLGQGGFARVYLATNRLSRAQVALKVLMPQRDGTFDADARRRFLREGRVLQRITHPHVVRILDAGEIDGLPYIASELLEGEDLSAMLARRGTLAPDETIEVLRQILSALGAAHREGLIHRDVKPENIRLCGAPHDPLHVKLLDFGIARDTEEGTPALTKTGELVGTPRYMAPEQLRGKPVTPATDLYAVGLVGLELLLGRDVLHGGSWGEQLDRLRSGYLVAVDRLHEIDPRLRGVLQRMTAVDVADRFATTIAVERALGGEEAGAPRVDAERGRPRRPLVVAAGVMVLVAVLVFALAGGRDTSSSDETGRALERRGAEDLIVDRSPPTAPEQRRPASDAEPVADAAQVLTLGEHASVGCSSERRDELAPAGLTFVERVPAVCQERDCPLVLAFHASRHRAFGGSTVAADDLAQALAPVAAEHELIVVAPVWAGPKHDTPWDATFDPDDVDRLYEYAARTRCVDQSRVFVLGYETGTKALLELKCRPWVTASAAFGRSFPVTMLDLAEHQCLPDERRPVLWIHPRHSERVPWTTARACAGHDYLTMGYDDVALWSRGMLGAREPARAVDLDVPGVTGCQRWDGDASLTACAADGGSRWPGMPPTPQGLGVACPLIRTESRADIGLAVWTYFASVTPLQNPPHVEPL